MFEISTPVVFIVFNRPDLTRQILARLATVKPCQLYVIADGPRPDNPNDIENCQLVRSVIDTIDWDCDVFKDYSAENLGCQQRIYTGLNWVFSQVDAAIILEDDCLPDISFFQFCQELLLRYKDDERVSVISGNNFQFGQRRTDDSYYFSRYPHCWGWATWRRAWKYCDIQMTDWPTVKEKNLLLDILGDHMAIRYWHHKFQQTYSGKINTWDYPWTLACWLKGGLSILPACNLVSNIGFTDAGTHSKDTKSPFASIPVREIKFPLIHPSYVLRNRSADEFTQRNMFGVVSRGVRKARALLRV